MIPLSLSKSGEKLDAENQSKRMIKMNKRKVKQMKQGLFNANKCQITLNFHTYKIIYNVLLYLAKVIYFLMIFIDFFSCL